MIELSTDGTNQGSGLWAYRYLGEGAGIGSGEGAGWTGGGEGLQQHEPRRRSGLQVPILVRGRPRARVET